MPDGVDLEAYFRGLNVSVEHDLRKIKREGKDLNLFNIMNIAWKENRLTDFLAFLLDPNGAHGLKELPLNEFLTIIGREDKVVPDLKNNTKHIKVVREYAFDNGRIDVCILQDGVVKIALEVKIYAGEQLNQIARYQDVVKETNGIVCFLTLRKHTPSSTKSLENVLCISWKEEIRQWLERLLELEALDNGRKLPILRVLIEQYRDVVLALTNNVKEPQMSELDDFIFGNESNYDTAQQVVKVFENLYSHVSERLEKAIKAYLDSKDKYKSWQVKGSIGAWKWAGMTIIPPDVEETSLMMCLEAQNAKLQNLCYGIYFKDKDKKERDYLFPNDLKVKEWKQSEVWPAWKWVEGSTEEWIRMVLFDANGLKQWVERVVEEMYVAYTMCVAAQKMQQSS